MRNAVAVILVGFGVCFSGCSPSTTPPGPGSDAGTATARPALVCHVGGTMVPLMEAMLRQYQEATGEVVEVNTGDSGSLIALIETQKRGDVYVCHDPFLDVLMKRGLGSDAWTLCELVPVIAVPKGNPKEIKGLPDLVRPDLELMLTDYEFSTLGRMLPTIFGKAGIDFAELNRRKTIHTHRSGSQAANVVKMGNADATIVWDAVAALRQDALEAIPLTPYLPTPEVDTVTSATGKVYRLAPVRVTLATLACSTHPERAAALARFVAAPERLEVFQQQGYTVDPSLRRQEYEGGRPVPRP